MRRLRLLILFVIASILLLVTGLVLFAPSDQLARFQRIELGMDREQVRNILVGSVVFISEWHWTKVSNEGDWIVVNFDENGRLGRKEWVPRQRTEFWDKVRGWFGL
jgi:hypothetical protein